MKPLNEKAMLVRLKRGQFNHNVTDQEATSLVENANGVKRVGKFKKVLFAESVRYADLIAAYGALYTYHQAHTIPWTDNGPRLLPSDMYFDYTADLRTLRGACDAALNLFLSGYNGEINIDKKRLGVMAKDSDYPPEEEMRKKFYHDIQFQPVPASGDFRVNISEEDRQSMERALHEAEQGMAQHIVESLLEPLKHAAEKLAIPIGEKGSVFRDTLIENLLEVCERLPKLDITGSPEVAAAVRGVQDIVGKYRNPELLREQPEIREAAASAMAAQVDDITKTFGGMFK